MSQGQPEEAAAAPAEAAVPNARELAKQRKRERKEQAANKAAAPPPEKPAKNPGKSPRAVDPAVQLSKALAYLLRHGAEKEHLPVRADGYLRVDAVLQRPRVQKLPMPAPDGKTRAPLLDDVLGIVDTNDKKRFEVRQGTDTDPHAGGVTYWIRAVQGHSLEQVTDLEHVQLTPENVHEHLALFDDKSRYAIHGTDTKAWEQIYESGVLKRMGRNHVHMAKGRPGEDGVISGTWKKARHSS